MVISLCPGGGQNPFDFKTYCIKKPQRHAFHRCFGEVKSISPLHVACCKNKKPCYLFESHWPPNENIYFTEIVAWTKGNTFMK